MEDIKCWETKFKSCYYSERLLTKLSLINEIAKNKIDLLKIKKAIYYAKKYHGTQLRQSGEPYYTHPLEVAFYVADYYFKTDILITSVLHDTIEDTKLNRDMIEYIFDSNIANQVKDLTRIKFNKKISSSEIVKLLFIQSKDDLLLIKLFDRLHNIQTIHIKSPTKKIKIIKETLESFISLSMYLQANIPNLFKITQTMLNLCCQQLPVKKQHPWLNLIKNSEDNFQLPFLFVQNVKTPT